MRLFYSQNSPYARVARIAVLESSLTNTVESIQVVNRSADNPLQALSPTRRVPTLVDGDLVLGETRLICAYLDDLQERAQFFPAGPPDWQSVSTESVVIAFMDSVVAQVSENRRPANSFSDVRIEYELMKTRNGLSHFESLLESNPDQFLSWNFRNISLAATLGLMDFHAFVPNWHSQQSWEEAVGRGYDASSDVHRGHRRGLRRALRPSALSREPK